MERLKFMALHELRFPQPVTEDYVGSATDAGKESLEHGQQPPPSGLMMDELEEAMCSVTI
jgi:hypothetical protein